MRRTRRHRAANITLPLDTYHAFFAALPDAVQRQVTERWGTPERDPHVGADGFRLPLIRLGEALVGVQPARGYDIDPVKSYHDPDLVPPHGYFAAYAYLRNVARIDAIIHNGKHGNLEWLPGKAMALERRQLSGGALGPLPHLYPFIVNDPGEGTQAKRRTGAVIIDHLVPPLTRAETYGPLKDLEALLDEYYAASHGPRRCRDLRDRILDLAHGSGIDRDRGIDQTDDAERR